MYEKVRFLANEVFDLKNETNSLLIEIIKRNARIIVCGIEILNIDISKNFATYLRILKKQLDDCFKIN